MGAEREVEKLRADLETWLSRLRESDATADELQGQFEDVGLRLATARADSEIYRKLTEGTQALLSRLAPQAVTELPPVVSAGRSGADVAAINGKPPRGRDAILRVMRERPGEWNQMDIVRAIMDKGWIDPNAKTPKEAIRVAIKRLVDGGELERLRPGVLRFPAHGSNLLNEEEVPAV